MGHFHAEPYREYLRDTRERLKATRDWLAAKLQGKEADDSLVIKSKDELLQPLLLCYRSLTACQLSDIANGKLLDLIHRVNCFGIELLKLDIRQESGRHRQAISAITEYLGLGNFETWTEQARQNFLLQELQSKRPLLPKFMQGTCTKPDSTSRCARSLCHHAHFGCTAAGKFGCLYYFHGGISK